MNNLIKYNLAHSFCILFANEFAKAKIVILISKKSYISLFLDEKHFQFILNKNI